MEKSEIEKFEKWCKVKKKINKLENKKYLHIKPKEIWYVNIGKNIGFESNGKSFNFKRPVLVLKIIGSLVFIATMTTKGKDNKFYFKINKKYFNKESYISLSQIKTIDKKRFIEKIGKLGINDFNKIKEKLKQLIL